jgi:hypothetical protein
MKVLDVLSCSKTKRRTKQRLLDEHLVLTKKYLIYKKIEIMNLNNLNLVSQFEKYRK